VALSFHRPPIECYTPHDADANDQPSAAVLGAETPAFAYLGTPLTPAAFAAYVQTYHFGTIPPDTIVLHHTAIPAASWAPAGDPDRWWDAHEGGLSALAIQAKRQKQLDALRDYYRSLGWSAGPHLFIDERWIWLFTPMNTIGIHAKAGNSWRSGGRLHYSIGIEVIGDYTRVQWPAAVAANVHTACQALAARLGIQLAYRPAPKNRPELHQGSVCSHRDFNKPACPGNAITEGYYIDVLTETPPAAPAADPYAVWAERWGEIATPTAASWEWDAVRLWKANYQRLGTCKSQALYDTANGIFVQCFAGGDIRGVGGRWEVCFR
jgi:hypothetical protein